MFFQYEKITNRNLHPSKKSDCHLHVVRRGQRTTQVFSFETCDMARRSCVQTVRPRTTVRYLGGLLVHAVFGYNFPQSSTSSTDLSSDARQRRGGGVQKIVTTKRREELCTFWHFLEIQKPGYTAD